MFVQLFNHPTDIDVYSNALPRVGWTYSHLIKKSS